MPKKSKAIKRLKKQLKKLNARVKTMGKQVKSLQDTSGDTVTEPMAKELQGEPKHDLTVSIPPRFSYEELEAAYGATAEAEEVLDIMEKEFEKGVK